MSLNLDLYDKKILYLLDLNSRLSASDIARRIRLPKETVNYRIKRLIENEHISSFYCIINGTSIGYYYSRIFMKFQNITADVERQIIEYIIHQNVCVNLRLTDGPFDLVFLAMHRYPMELSSLLNDFNIKFGQYLQMKSINSVNRTYKLNQKFFYNEISERTEIFHGIVNNPVELDKLDIQIINLLAVNARIRLIDLANSLNQKPELIKYRIRMLENKKVIAGYFTQLNLNAFKREFVQVDISLRDPRVILSIIEYFDSTSTCLFAYELTGKYDLSFEIYTKDDFQLREILRGFKEKFNSFFILFDVSHIYERYTINWSPYGANA